MNKVLKTCTEDLKFVKVYYLFLLIWSNCEESGGGGGVKQPQYEEKVYGRHN